MAQMSTTAVPGVLGAGHPSVPLPLPPPLISDTPPSLPLSSLSFSLLCSVSFLLPLFLPLSFPLSFTPCVCISVSSCAYIHMWKHVYNWDQKHVSPHLAFFISAGVSNSGPLACTLSTELSPQPSGTKFQGFRTIHSQTLSIPTASF